MEPFMDRLEAEGLLIDHPVESVVFALSNTTRSMASISKSDVEKFGFEMDQAIRHLHPAVQDILVRNAGALLDTVRVLNVETKAGFRGAAGSGNTIDFKISNAGDYYDPDGATDTTVRTQWKRYISAITTSTAGDKYITGTGGSAADWTMSEEQALLLLGFTDKAGEAKVDALQITYAGDPMNIQMLHFDQAAVGEQNLVVMELKEPAMIAPEQSIMVNVRYNDIGWDYLQPIAVMFERSIDMRSL